MHNLINKIYEYIKNDEMNVKDKPQMQSFDIKFVFKKLDIPLSRLRVYHMFRNTIEFNIRQYIKKSNISIL